MWGPTRKCEDDTAGGSNQRRSCLIIQVAVVRLSETSLHTSCTPWREVETTQKAFRPDVHTYVSPLNEWGSSFMISQSADKKALRSYAPNSYGRGSSIPRWNDDGVLRACVGALSPRSVAHN